MRSLNTYGMYNLKKLVDFRDFMGKGVKSARFKQYFNIVIRR